MTVKKEYIAGDTVWIYGISSKNAKPTKGKVIKVLDLSDVGYSDGPHYLVEIPTHIDPLLEIRTWETISQDEKGPVGSLRGIGELVPTIKRAKTVGFIFDDEYDDDPTPDEIHAAIEKSQQATTHQPLILKENKPRRRNFSRKKKQ